MPRVLPAGLTAHIDRAAWRVPPLFAFLQEAGGVDRDEMYRVFNMGIGMIVIVRARDVLPAMAALRAAGEKPVPIGNVQRGAERVRLVN
ncbi:MAG: Phosphoribosylformylglycinamidine cyclo-ligase [Candidatus Aminicenantes bacterium ADurb.Bin508]|nr:MAG: Phosphoribosylformylglycinamidine cyclo-ligase [Candidatus Aminicenantes bacterium ADurb.Bin508]